MDPAGFEPATFTLQRWCTPNCAIGPKAVGLGIAPRYTVFQAVARTTFANQRKARTVRIALTTQSFGGSVASLGTWARVLCVTHYCVTSKVCLLV